MIRTLCTATTLLLLLRTAYSKAKRATRSMLWRVTIFRHSELPLPLLVWRRHLPIMPGIEVCSRPLYSPSVFSLKATRQFSTLRKFTTE